MKKFLLNAVLTAVLLSGCTSVADESANRNARANEAVKTAMNPPNQTLNAPNISTNTALNAAPPPPENTNSERQPEANLSLIDGSEISRRSLQRMRSKGGANTANVAPIAAVTPTPFAAPDDSALTSTMNAQGVPIETRVFRRHPQLLKLEKTFADISNPVTKVYLKNGKVLTAPKDSIANPETATAAEILRAVGVQP